MFYDKFLALCIKRNMSPSAAAIDAGFSNAAAAGWKKGAVPRDSAVKKLAAYFGVPVSYFSEEAPETEKAPVSDKETEDFTKYFAMLTPEHQQQIRSAMAELIKEQLQG